MNISKYIHHSETRYKIYVTIIPLAYVSMQVWGNAELCKNLRHNIYEYAGKQFVYICMFSVIYVLDYTFKFNKPINQSK